MTTSLFPNFTGLFKVGVTRALDFIPQRTRIALQKACVGRKKIFQDKFFPGLINKSIKRPAVTIDVLENRSDRLRDAVIFARNKHRGQVRKFENRPYFTHCAAVACILARFIDDEDIIIACLLHDTIEDTETLFEEIADLFGERVALLVMEVTKPSFSEMVSREYILDQVNLKLMNSSSEGASIKLADISHNIGGIGNALQHDPEFAKSYVEEKTKQIQFLKHGDPRLYALAESIIKHANQQLINAGLA